MMTKKDYDLESGVKEIKSRINGLLEKKSLVVVGIAGGTASGKTFVAKKIGRKTILIDNYCKGAINGKNTNFDAPETYDLGMLAKQLSALQKGKTVKVPVYDMVSRSRIGFRVFQPAKVIVVEGLFALNPALRAFLDLKVFVNSQNKTRFSRRLKRDIAKKVWSEEELRKYYRKIIVPMHKAHVEPTKKVADIIINN